MYSELRNKKRNMAPVIILFMLMVLLAGCGKDNGKEAEAVSEETQTISVAATDKEETEVGDEVAEAEEMQTAAEEPVKMTLQAWGDSLSYTEPKLGVWNTKIGQGKIFEGDEEYTISEDEWLMVYCPEEYKDIKFNDVPSIVQSLDIFGKFTMINYREEYKAKNEISVTVLGVEGKDYELNVCLLSPNGAEDDTSVKENEVFSIEGWMDELILTEKEPRIIVWNEETGTKRLLENGEEYQLQEGDKIGVYYPDGFGPYYGQPKETDSYELGYYNMEIQLVDKEKVNFEYVMAADSADTKDTKVYATFTK